MNKEQLQAKIMHELEKIPRGPSGSAQNRFRSAYEIRRQHCLKEDELQPPVEQFLRAVEDVRKDDPDFFPSVTDHEYFGWG